MRRSISPIVHQFDDSLWTASPFGARSKECSPLYIDRYAGGRKSLAPNCYSCWELTAMISGSTRITTGKTTEAPAKPPFGSRGRSPSIEKTPFSPELEGERPREPPFASGLAGASTVTERKDELLLIAPDVRNSEEGEMADTIWLGFTGERVAAATRGLGPLTLVRSHALTESVERLWFFAHQRGGPIGPDLARRFNCSEGHFCRVFRGRTGYPPVTYILRARIRLALHLLQNTDWPVAKVAQAVGIANPFYFSRAFRRITGRHPTDCRGDRDVIGDR